MSIRDEIRQLCAAHDRFMAEQASEPIRRSPVSETDVGGEPEAIPSGEAAAPEGYLPDEVIQLVADAIYNAEQRMRMEFERKLAIVDGELRETRGMLGATLTLLGARTADVPKGQVIDVPARRNNGA